MALRISKRFGALLLTVFLLLGLSSCFDDLGNLNLNISKDQKVNVVYQILDHYYYEDLPLNLKKISSLEELFNYTDPYTYIYKLDTRDIEKGEEYLGFGLTISDHPLGLLVTAINKETDIDKHIYAGDIIFKVNELNLADLSFDLKTDALKGEKGEVKEIYLKRDNKEVLVTRTLEEIPFNSVLYEKVTNEIGYIKINRFAEETGAKFLIALEALEDNLETLIIDVRDNGGGYLKAVKDILENFIVDENPYLYLYNVKANEKEPYYSPLNELKPYNIIVLVNNNSASASEVLAGTLFKYGYDVFGERTYGKDVYQAGISLNNVSDVFAKDDVLNITMGYWLLNDETRVAGGLEPTIAHIQTGVYALNYPFLIQKYNNNELIAITYQIGEANLEIYTYQYLLNMLKPFNYEKGLFDDSTKLRVEEFQAESFLEVTGILDVETQMLLIDYYRSLIKDKSYDNQLNSLISYIINNES